MIRKDGGRLVWLKERYGAQSFLTDECLPFRPPNGSAKQMIDRQIECEVDELRFEKNLSRELLTQMRDAGCLKIVFGLESFNQRVMDFMKKGIKQEWVRRIVDDCVDLGIAVHCYVIVGFPTEKEEALETMNFVVQNTKLHESYGFSCQPCLFDLEPGSPDHE